MLFRAIFLSLLTSLVARAHSGKESEIDISLFEKRVTVVVRCAPSLAWHFLGPDAPRGPLAAAFESARSDLEALAPGLLELSHDRRAAKPTRVRVDLEPDHHVAFTLHYDPPKLPLTLKAAFLSKLDELEPATVRFFDRSSGERAAKPFASHRLLNAGQSIRFELGETRMIHP